MTRLSVNINKIATLRNARGGSRPDLVQFAKDCERFGAEGITVHPRPDGRHIKYDDVFDLKDVVNTEFNIEGYPNRNFLDLVLEVKPDQCTLVPDAPEVLTSNAGWDTISNYDMLAEVCAELHAANIRVSLFLDPEVRFLENAHKLGVDRIELYTEAFAKGYTGNKESAVLPYITVANEASSLGLGINAGHDLDLNNLSYLKESIPQLKEVSIGHALISDALYFGIENTIQMYRRKLSS